MRALVAVWMMAAICLSGCGGGGGGGSSGGGSNPSSGTKNAVLTANAPTQIQFGDSLSFTVSATDAGSNASPFKLLYGPAGMSISPTGEVTWRAILPMFSRATDVNYSVGMGDSKLALTIKVIDDARKPPLILSGDQYPQRDGGVLISDLHHDGHASLLVAGSVGVEEYSWDGARYSRRWNHAFTGDAFGPGIAIAAGDVTGDALQEIFVSVDDKVLRLDGATREQSGEFDLRSTQEHCAKLIVADLDLDGAAELVCQLIVKGEVIPTQTGVTSGDVPAIVVIDAAQMKQKWRGQEHAVPEGISTGMAIGNVDSDPALEIVTGWGAVIDGSSFETQWQYDDGFGTKVAVGDMTGDGVAEIFGSAHLQWATVFSALTQSSLATITLPNASPHEVLVCDADGDGTTDLLLADGNDPSHIHVYHYMAGAFVHVTSVDAQGYLVTGLAVGDADHDGSPELVWGTDVGSSLQDRLVVAHIAGTPAVEWTTDTHAVFGPPFFGGQRLRTSQGEEQLVFGSGGDATFGALANQILSLDPNTGAMQSLESFTGVSSGLAIAVGDYDGDGVDEVVHGVGDAYTGTVSVLDVDSRTTQWSSSALSMPGVQSVAVASADVNGDSFSEVIDLSTESPGGTHVRVLDVRHNSMLWDSGQIDGNPMDMVVVKAANGQFDIVVATTSGLSLFAPSPNGGYALSATRSVQQIIDLVAADLTSDGIDEIYYMTADGGFASAPKLGQVDFSLAQVTEIGLPSIAFGIAAEESAASGGSRNIVVATSVVPGSQPFTARLTAIDPRTGKEIWRTPPLQDVPTPNHLFFFGSANRPRISFSGVASLYVTN